MKDKRVENAHLKFHNILVILQFLMELAMHMVTKMKVALCVRKEQGWHTCPLLELFEFALS